MSNIVFYTMFKEANDRIKIFTIKGYHHTMDMSVSNISHSTQMLLERDFDNLSSVELKTLSCCGSTQLISVSPDCIKVKWGGEEYTVALGEEITTSSRLLNNPYLSVDEVYMKYEYRELEPWDMLSDMNEWIINFHKKHLCDIEHCRDEQEMMYQLIYDLIERGEVGLYPVYALYRSAKSWFTMEITDYALFNKIMQEGIEKGCFRECSAGGIANFAQLVEHNPLEKMYAHVSHLEESIKALADAGNEIATAICNGEICYKEKTSCKNPEKKELILTVTAKLYDNHDNIGERIIRAANNKKNKTSETYIDEEWEMLFGNELGYIELDSAHMINEEIMVITEAEMTKGSILHLGFGGDVTIENVENNELTVVWKEKEYRIKDRYDKRVTSDLILVDSTLPDQFMQLSFNLYNMNVWQKVRNLIESVIYRQTSSNFREKWAIESQKSATRKLINLLMKREGEDLEELYNILQENDNWRIVGFGGERRDLTE